MAKFAESTSSATLTSFITSTKALFINGSTSSAISADEVGGRTGEFDLERDTTPHRTSLRRNSSEGYRHPDVILCSEIVYFDLVPPLRYLGSVSLRQRFLEWFARFESPIAQTVSSFEVSGNREHASAFMLIRAGGTLKSGAVVDYWVRATSCLERSAEQWLIRHEHISVPADLIGGRALTDLAP